MSTSSRTASSVLEQLYEILRGYPGKCEVQLVLTLADETKVWCDCEMRVELNPEMRGRIADLLGTGQMRPLAAPPPRNTPPSNRSNGYARAK